MKLEHKEDIRHAEEKIFASEINIDIKKALYLKTTEKPIQLKKWEKKHLRRHTMANKQSLKNNKSTPQ